MGLETGAVTMKPAYRSVLACSLVLFCAAGTTQAAAQTPSDLSSWAGKDPFGGRQQRSFWSEPAVAQGLERTLGKGRKATFLTKWEVRTGNLERVGDVLTVGGCMPHDCGSNKAILYINVHDGSVEACWQNSDPRNPSRETEMWLTPTGSRVLPAGSCQRAWLSPAGAYPTLRR